MAAKGKPRKGKPLRARVKARVSQAASIREFHDAVLHNIDEAYWETAIPVLDGNIRPELYPSEVARLQAFKEAGALVRNTLLERDEEEQEDKNDQNSSRPARK